MNDNDLTAAGLSLSNTRIISLFKIQQPFLVIAEIFKKV